LPPSLATRVAEALQTVLTGLILAFIFRAFLVEPFIIPTGSMAESLLGAHATQTCPACGWVFNFAPLATATPTGGGFVRPAEIICPNCQLRLAPTAADTVPVAGDRILVHKWPYFSGLIAPQRWDVLVFRDPANPEQHYIKRLVGLPGEKIELIAGDVFINDRIARKPPEIQRALWFIVFDQAHLPRATSDSPPAPRWRSPEPPPAAAAGWSGMDTRIIRYDGLDDTPRRLSFNPDTAPEYLEDVYGYDRGSGGNFVGDVRLVAELTLHDGGGWCRWELVRPPYRFSAHVGCDGGVELAMTPLADPNAQRVVAALARPPLPRDWPLVIEFGHVDYRVYLKLDNRELLCTSDADYAPDLAELRSSPIRTPVGLSLAASGVRLELRGLRIDRDVYYTRSPQTRRALPGRPFTLHDDEFFVLGDNSPDSHDSREWTERGPHLPPDYRPGTVLRSQIVGPAAFVYLPGLLRVGPGGRLLVPDLGRTRFVR
jgi:signal peptidase I